MKQWITLLLILLLLVPCAMGAVVTRVMPSVVEPGTSFEVKFRIIAAVQNQTFTLEETRPLQVEITDWRIEGAQEERDKIETRQKDLGFGWSFTTASDDVTITYTAKVSPQAIGELAFEAVYFDPDGFNRVPGVFDVVVRSKPKAGRGETNISAGKAAGVNASGAAGDKGTTGSSMLIGMSIIAGIIIIGLGVFFYMTQPRKRSEVFNDGFFKK